MKNEINDGYRLGKLETQLEFDKKEKEALDNEIVKLEEKKREVTENNKESFEQHVKYSKAIEDINNTLFAIFAINLVCTLCSCLLISQDISTTKALGECILVIVGNFCLWLIIFTLVERKNMKLMNDIDVKKIIKEFGENYNEIDDIEKKLADKRQNNLDLLNKINDSEKEIQNLNLSITESISNCDGNIAHLEQNVNEKQNVTSNDLENNNKSDKPKTLGSK